MIQPARLYDRLSSLVDFNARRRRGAADGALPADPLERLAAQARALPEMKSETRALALAAAMRLSARIKPWVLAAVMLVVLAFTKVALPEAASLSVFTALHILKSCAAGLLIGLVLYATRRSRAAIRSPLAMASFSTRVTMPLQ